MSTPDRVAVVVGHGIADQRAGQTVREIARLLCHGGQGEPRYVQGEMHDVLVPVAKLEPGGAASRPAAQASTDGGRKAETSRRRPGTPSGFYQAQKSVPVVAAAEASTSDLGLALNDYLLGRLAWLMKGPAALVQVSMLLLVLFGAAALVSPEQQGQVLAALFAVGAIVLTALAALAWLRGASRVGRWAKLLVLLAAALACSVVVIVALSD